MIDQTLNVLCRVYKNGQRLPETVFVDDQNVSTYGYLENLSRDSTDQCDSETARLLFADRSGRLGQTGFPGF